VTSLEGYCPPTRPDAVIFRGAGALHSRFILFLIRPTSSSTPPHTPGTRPHPLQMSHACSFDPAADRHPTPPLSPSLSSGSSRQSSAPSFSTTSSSSPLPRDIDGLHPTYPDPQPVGHSNPVIELGRMSHGLGDDTVMLDEWEGEGKREERDHGKHILEISFFLSFFFHSWRSRFVM
jgi:hypothetical protein